MCADEALCADTAYILPEKYHNQNVLMHKETYNLLHDINRKPDQQLKLKKRQYIDKSFF